MKDKKSSGPRTVLGGGGTISNLMAANISCRVTVLGGGCNYYIVVYIYFYLLFTTYIYV